MEEVTIDVEGGGAKGTRVSPVCNDCTEKLGPTLSGLSKNEGGSV